MIRAVSGPGDPRFPGGPPVVPFVPGPATTQPLGDLRSRVYDQLLTRRTVLLDRALDGETATFVTAQLMTLDADGDEPVELLVNSPGGPLDAAGAVLDTIDLMRVPVGTVCLGQATGTAAIVVASGTGRRRAGTTARLQLRFPQIEVSGPASRLAEEVAGLSRLHDALVARLAAATGQTRAFVERDIERGRMLSGEEAVAYGLVDELVSARDRGGH